MIPGLNIINPRFLSESAGFVLCCGRWIAAAAALGASQLIALEEQLHSWVTGVKKNNLVHLRVSK